VDEMQFTSELKRHVDPSFLRTWEHTLRVAVESLNQNLTHADIDEILVDAYWVLNANTWIEKPQVLKGVLGNQLDVIHRCLGQNASASLHQRLNRLRGSNLAPTDMFWRDLSLLTERDSAFKGRLIKAVLPAFEHGTVENALTGGVEILKNKPFLLRQYQLEMINAIYSEVMNEQERLMLKLPTGSGKTRVALEAIYKLMFEKQANVVLWIADEKQLCEQAVDSAKIAFHSSEQGLEELVLVSFFDSNALTNLEALRNSNGANMLIVCTPHQLKENLNLLPAIDLFVMDEAHTSVQQRSDLFHSTGAKVMLGLSATPPTHWTETKTLTPRASFDSMRLSTEDFLRQEGVLSTLIPHSRRMVDEIDYESMIQLIGENTSPKFHHPFVIFSILSNIIQDLNGNLVNSSIVFVDRVEQAAILSAAFNKLMPGYRAGVIEGRMSTAQRHALLGQFRDRTIDVLFNVRMLREGFDSPNIDGVYLAMINNPEPASTKYIQMVGRGLRGTASEGGTECCHVVTIDYNYQ
jgi:superfamily II DNA or RNA helicase